MFRVIKRAFVNWAMPLSGCVFRQQKKEKKIYPEIGVGRELRGS